jgi:hypothetical protein
MSWFRKRKTDPQPSPKLCPCGREASILVSKHPICKVCYGELEGWVHALRVDGYDDAHILRRFIDAGRYAEAEILLTKLEGAATEYEQSFGQREPN